MYKQDMQVKGKLTYKPQLKITTSIWDQQCESLRRLNQKINNIKKRKQHVEYVDSSNDSNWKQPR
jgi:hypothetical protein